MAREMMNNYLNCIREYWHIATTKTPLYEYKLMDVELQEREGVLKSILYYRVIGARTVEQASASELNEFALFGKFKPVEAQMIVTLAVVESLMTMPIDEIQDKYREYLKRCARQIKSR